MLEPIGEISAARRCHRLSRFVQPRHEFALSGLWQKNKPDKQNILVGKLRER